jgi:CPA1 family monovalent cation:H+ antiporter
LPLSGKAVVDARDESGTDPTIVDVLLRGLDARGVQPE